MYVGVGVENQNAYYAYVWFYKALCYGLQHFIQYSDRDLIKETFFPTFKTPILFMTNALQGA